MGIQSENNDFLCFRDRHDPEALARVFDAVAPRLLLLAAHLTPDAAQAEDLVQATFLQAMTAAPSYDGQRAVSAWLAGILRHCALDSKRRNAVRRTELLNDEVAAMSGLGSEVFANVSESELFESVSAAIDALESPYREVLVLRLVHGLAPTEIAHSLGRRPGSVRMQLKRGLEKLRQDMPQFASVFGFALVDTTRGLSSVREVLMTKATALETALSTSSIAGTQLAASSSASGLLGGLLVMKIVWTAVAVSVLGMGALWFTNKNQDPASVSPELAFELGEQTINPIHKSQPGSTLSKRAAASLSTAPNKPSALADVTLASLESSALRVHVRFESDGSEAVDIGVYLRSAAAGGYQSELRTDSTGRATFEHVQSGPWEIHVDRLAQPIAIESTAEVAEILIPFGIQIEGRVVDTDGRGVESATVYRFNPRHVDMLQEIAHTDSAGKFVLRDAPPEGRYLARAKNYQPSELSWGAEAHESELRLVLGALGHRLNGVVIDAEGLPVPKALIAIGVDEDARESRSGSTRTPGDGLSRKPLDRETILLRADEDGAFETDQVPGGHAVVFARPPLHPQTSSLPAGIGVTEVWIGSDNQAQSIVVQLEAGSEIFGILRDERGQALAGYRIESSWEGTPQLGQLEDDLAPRIATQSTVSHADGSFRLLGLLAGDHDLVISSHGRELLKHERFGVGHNSEHEWNPVIASTTSLSIRLLDPQGQPLPNWAVSPSQLARFGEKQLARTNQNGELKLAALTPYQPVNLILFAPLPGGSLHELAATTRHGIYPQSRVYEIRLNPDEMPTASTRGLWIQSNGEPVAGAGIQLTTLDGLWATKSVTDARGEFQFTNLAAGDYALRTGFSASPPGRLLTSFNLAPAESKDLGSLAIEGLTRLVVSIKSGGASDYDLVWLKLISMTPEATKLGVEWKQNGSIWTSSVVPAGSYGLIMTGPHCAPLFKQIEVRNEPELAISFERKVGAKFSAEILLPKRHDKFVYLTLKVWNSDGTRIVLTNSFSSIEDQSDVRVTWENQFLPGSYRLEVADDAGNLRAVNFEVGENGGSAQLTFR